MFKTLLRRWSYPHFQSITEFISAFSKHMQKHYEWANNVAVPYQRQDYLLTTTEHSTQTTDKENAYYAEASRKYDRQKYTDCAPRRSEASGHRSD